MLILRWTILSARWSSHEEIPLRLLAISHIAGSHFSKPSGESSKIVPSLTLNCALGCRVLHWNMRRDAMNPTSFEPHVGQTIPFGQRRATTYLRQLSGSWKYTTASVRVRGPLVSSLIGITSSLLDLSGYGRYQLQLRERYFVQALRDVLHEV